LEDDEKTEKILSGETQGETEGLLGAVDVGSRGRAVGVFVVFFVVVVVVARAVLAGGKWAEVENRRATRNFPERKSRLASGLPARN